MFDRTFHFLTLADVRAIGETAREAAFAQVMNYFNQNQEKMARIIETEVDVSVEKWPAPNLVREARQELNLKRYQVPTLRHSQAFGAMVRHAQSDKIERPYMLRYFGP
jgi:ATP-dependent helicase/DNAse subunit B